jgi:hypothetical protein
VKIVRIKGLFKRELHLHLDLKSNEIPKVPFTYRKYKEKYIIIEIDNVPSGEYGIVFTSNDYSNLNTNLNAKLQFTTQS